MRIYECRLCDKSGDGPAVAFDDVTQKVVLFGGYSPTDEWESDTWSWDGTHWAQLTSDASPSSRSSAAGAWDLEHGTFVIYGGNNASTSLPDTWLWNGASWSMAPATGPGDLNTSLAYDAARRQVVLFGGSAGYPTFSNTTWTWDGTTWAQRFPAHAPSARQAALAYDAARQEVVLFGGDTTNTVTPGETWTWDGTDWTLKTPTTSPSARNTHALAYDSDRQRVVLFGGSAPEQPFNTDDTWEWDGTTWAQRMPAVSPPDDAQSVLVYDAARHRMIMMSDTGMWFWVP